MNLDIKANRTGDATVVQLRGRLVLGEATNRLRDFVDVLMDEGHNHILVDLTNVPYVDSGGIGQLVGCHTTVTRGGGEFRLTGMSARVSQLLDMTGVTTVLDIVETENAQPISMREAHPRSTTLMPRLGY